MPSGQAARWDPSNLSSRTAYARAAILGGFSELVASSGGDAVALAAHVGIPERALRDPDMVIAWTAVGDLMELAAQELGKPAIGLEWLLAAPAPLLNFGAISLIARFTDTIGEWCFHSRNYWHWHTNAAHATLLESADLFTLRVAFSKLVPPSRHQVEYIMGGVCVLVSALTKDAPGFEVIRFRHMRPADTTLHETFFPCPVEYGCPHDELVYRRDLHEHPIALDAEALERWFTHYVKARTWTIPDYDGTTRALVEIAIPSLMGTEFCTQPRIAELLSMGAKTLQRQLAREGTSFPALHDKIRERIARQLLAGSDVPVRNIAGLLGYAWTPAFTTAARRWTGMSARSFRNAARNGEPGEAAGPPAPRRDEL